MTTSIENDPIPAEVSLMKSGGQYYFQNDQGNSFYTFDEDEKNKSRCVGACAKSWAPVTGGGAAKPIGDWTLATRPDGKKQWAYKGHPIYTNAAENAGGAAPDLSTETHWHKLVP
jgi:predicted lipoprotein with Yx(FWY)xxD motif